MMGALAYREQLGALLPPGRAWPRSPASTLGRLLAGYADEFARVDARSSDLLDEADPRSTLELLPDWERVAGLPDTCSGSPDTIHERQIALANKIASLGGQSISYFVALADRLGFAIKIEEFSSCDAGFGAGDDCNGDAWRFAWRVNVYLQTDDYRASSAEFSAGSDAGELLAGFAALRLECLIERARPAHTTVSFAYHQEPEPALWFDFTSEG